MSFVQSGARGGLFLQIASSSGAPERLALSRSAARIEPFRAATGGTHIACAARVGASTAASVAGWNGSWRPGGMKGARGVVAHGSGRNDLPVKLEPPAGRPTWVRSAPGSQQDRDNLTDRPARRQAR